MQLALAGDTMLGRLVGERMLAVGTDALVSDELAEVTRSADLFVLNLECCISERGERFADPRKPFFFRAPPMAVELLERLGVDAVTLANNHALDYGPVALMDTLTHLDDAGIAHVGAGGDVDAARQPIVLDRDGTTVAVVAVTDHPAAYGAAAHRPGVAHADLRRGVPAWLIDTVGTTTADVVLVSPHWGPNMTASPVPHVLAAATALRDAGATLVAGHSAHVFHGLADGVLYDLGDFLDDYARDPVLRNDRGLLFLVTIADRAVTEVAMVPLALDHCHTRLADEQEARWITDRMRRACSELGADVEQRGDRLVVRGAGKRF